MALTTEFERELLKLFSRRTSWLRKAIGKNRPGRPHIFNRKKVEPKLNELGELAAEILVRRRARRQFYLAVDGKRQWHVKRGKGFGIEAKRNKLGNGTRSISGIKIVFTSFGLEGNVSMLVGLRGERIGLPVGLTECGFSM